jgi:hypothetical protein
LNPRAVYVGFVVDEVLLGVEFISSTSVLLCQLLCQQCSGTDAEGTLATQVPRNSVSPHRKNNGSSCTHGSVALYSDVLGSIISRAARCPDQVSAGEKHRRLSQNPLLASSSMLYNLRDKVSPINE